jgi:hypothetical protein
VLVVHKHQVDIGSVQLHQALFHGANGVLAALHNSIALEMMPEGVCNAAAGCRRELDLVCDPDVLAREFALRESSPDVRTVGVHLRGVDQPATPEQVLPYACDESVTVRTLPAASSKSNHGHALLEIRSKLGQTVIGNPAMFLHHTSRHIRT